MSPPREVVLLLLLLHQSPDSLCEDHAVDLEAKTNWYCYGPSGRWYWTGQSLEDGCYRYVCKQDQGVLRVWTPEVLPHCCARNGKAYNEGEVILSEKEKCREVEEVCLKDGDHSFVLRTVNNTCCADNMKEKESFVQWFSYLNLASNKMLDVAHDGGLSLTLRNKSRDTQKWRLENGKLLNKQFPGKVLGLSGDLQLSLVDLSSVFAFQSITFDEGHFTDLSSSYSLTVSSSGLVGVQFRAKRQAAAVDTSFFVGERAGDVECEELDWKPFKPFHNNEVNTQCWEEIEPSFRLYVSPGEGVVVQDSKRDLLRLQHNTDTPVQHLVVIIHGLGANADTGTADGFWASVWAALSGPSWAHEMANLILEEDTRPGLAVLTVDWSEGAAHMLHYEVAAANTRYVGVATERVVRQINQVEEVSIHCIGHSLGAHTCGFFGNAVTEDETYKPSQIDRITALDPAGPLFTRENFGSLSNLVDLLTPTDPLETAQMRDDERLEASDALLVQAIHTDSDTFGLALPVGDADFYIGKDTESLGVDQGECFVLSVLPCDHGRAHELMRQSIAHKDRCWAHFTCTGTSRDLGCTVPASCSLSPSDQQSFTYPEVCGAGLVPRHQFGYWWDGTGGSYGVVLQTEECWQCVDDSQCSADKKCDVLTHLCVSEECLRDEHCDSGSCQDKKCQSEDCGRRRKREASRVCSTEPAEACKVEGGYCGNPASCEGTVLDNKCPGGQDNKCCIGMPFQEEECEAQAGDCLDTCDCEAGDYLHGFCPSQPNSIKCCPRKQETETGLCPIDTNPGPFPSSPGGNINININTGGLPGSSPSSSPGASPGGATSPGASTGGGATDCSRLTCKTGEMSFTQ